MELEPPLPMFPELPLPLPPLTASLPVPVLLPVVPLEEEPDPVPDPPDCAIAGIAAKPIVNKPVGIAFDSFMQVPFRRQRSKSLSRGL